MNYNSSKNYNSGYNYNGVSTPVIFTIPIYDYLSFDESFDYSVTTVVAEKETSFFISDGQKLDITNIDFSVGNVSGEDTSSDWFNPLDMKVDWANTMIQVMPSSESEYVDISTIDGSFLKNTIYKNRSFSFILYSRDGLSDSEKDNLKQKIVKVLDSTKGSFKKLYIPPSEHFFYAKYSGSASVQTGPSYIKATIPFEVKPYSYPIFENKIVGSGVIYNNGLKDCGLIFEISGPASSPGFYVELSTGKSFMVKWNGSISLGITLVINGENLTCYKKYASGATINAITELNYESSFISVPKGEYAKISNINISSSNLITKINESYIW